MVLDFIEYILGKKTKLQLIVQCAFMMHFLTDATDTPKRHIVQKCSKSILGFVPVTSRACTQGFTNEATQPFRL